MKKLIFASLMVLLTVVLVAVMVSPLAAGALVAGLVMLPFFLGGVLEEVERQGGIGFSGSPLDPVDSDLYVSPSLPWDKP